MNNSSDFPGGAIELTGSSATIVSATVCDNYAPNAGAAILCDDNTSATLENCIVAFNGEGEAVSCDTGGGVSLSCCDIYGNVGGDWGACIENQLGVAGNIWEDPLFCDPENGDLRLQENSPCAPFSPPNSQCDLIGAWPLCGSSSAPAPGIDPAGRFLSPCEPNPFRYRTRVTYSVPDGSAALSVVLRIHELSGRPVRTLAATAQPPGTHSVTWDGLDDAGRAAPAGIYFVRMNLGETTVRTRKVLRLR